MNYPDVWVFKFDDETIVKDLETLDYSRYISKGEITISAWKNIDLSYHEHETLIQKVIVSQAQVIFTFLSTEAVCNDNKFFIQYTKLMMEYIKSEMIYCYHFWKYSTLRDFVKNRLNATLIRTFRFLKSLQINVLHKYINERNTKANFNFEADPHHEALNDYLEDMLVEYEDLKTFISYFAKTYGDLYNKMQRFKPQLGNQIEMIGKIYVMSTTFFDVHPKAIQYPIVKAFSKDPEKPLLLDLFTHNDQMKVLVEEKSKQKFKDEEDLQIERYFRQSLRLDDVIKIQQGIDDPNKNKLEASVTEKVKPKSGFADRLQQISTEVLENSPENETKSRNGSHNKSHHNTMVSEKSTKDYNSVSDILRNSVDNPFRVSVTNPVFTYANTNQESRVYSKPKSISEQMFKSEAKPSPKSVGTNSSLQTPSQKTSTVQKFRETSDFEEKLTYSLSSDVIEEMLSKKLEPQRFRVLEKNEEDDSNRKGSFKRQRARIFSKIETVENIAEMLSGDSSGRKRSKSKSKSPLQRKMSEFINFDSSMLEENGQKYVPYRENRGQDIPDEKILGNLIENNDNGSMNEDSMIMELLESGQDYRSRFISKIKTLENNKVLPMSHENMDKYSINLGRTDEVFKQRHKHKWSIVQDNMKGAIVQKQIFEIKREEDPTDGSGVVFRKMNYLQRKGKRIKSSEIDFNQLSEAPHANYKILTVRNNNNESVFKAVKASILP